RAGLSQGAIDLLGNLSPLIGDFYYTSSTELLGEVYTLDFASLYRIDGGTSKLPLALFNSFNDVNTKKYYPDIPSHLLGNVHWKGGHFIEKVQQASTNGPVTLYYKNKVNNRKKCQTFDYVISA